jgi:peptidyl-prolyl cis-trans isomerase C
MKTLLLLSFCAASACAQQAAPTAGTAPEVQIPDTAVIAKIDGRPLTMGELKTYTSFLPPDGQRVIMVNPEMVLRQMVLMHKLSELAVEQKMDQASPVREQLEFNRDVVLSAAGAQYLLNSPTVDPIETLNFYNAHKEDFKQVKVKAIYISFSLTPAPKGGPKVLSEEEAKAKATRLLAAIRGGADFVKLVRENSDDATSKARDGDFATVTPAENIPDAMRAAVFQLKPGETSEPVRQPSGFYLLRAEQVSYLPLSQVRDQIFAQIKENKGKALLDKMSRETQIEFPNPAFPGKSPAPAAAK